MGRAFRDAKPDAERVVLVVAQDDRGHFSSIEHESKRLAGFATAARVAAAASTAARLTASGRHSPCNTSL
jgi:hypothetical protein